MKTTLKDIKAFYCEDITTLSSEDVKALKDKEVTFIRVCYSVGVYGLTGCILQGYTTKTLYKITSRNSNLFYLY
jgi:hypothetical protein